MALIFLSNLLQEHAMERVEIVEDPARLSLECYQRMRRKSSTVEQQQQQQGLLSHSHHYYRRKRSSMSRWDCASEAETLPASALWNARLERTRSIESLQVAVDVASALMGSFPRTSLLSLDDSDDESTAAAAVARIVAGGVPSSGLLRRQSSDTQPQRPARRASIDRTTGATERQCTWAQSA